MVSIRYDLQQKPGFATLPFLFNLSERMDKVGFAKQFACRLKEAMMSAGLTSSRSTSGVCIHQLAEITHYSLQICRRYLRGEAIPEPIKLVEMAEKLNTSPGWLLFGESSHAQNAQKLTIDKKLLHYIFLQAGALYNAAETEDTAAFLTNLANDVSLISASEEQSKKIIDLALSSVNYFNH